MGKRYCSDRTCTSRVYEDMDFERSQHFTKKERQKVYDIVLKAQLTAIKKARVGMMAKDIDKLARDVIEKAGYGKYFIHSTGHGVGLDIHEHPYINSRSETMIEKVITLCLVLGTTLMAEFRSIKIPEFEKMQKEGVVVVDIRRPDEWKATGIIKGSIKNTFFDAGGRYDLRRWLAELEKHVSSKADPV